MQKKMQSPTWRDEGMYADFRAAQSHFDMMARGDGTMRTVTREWF